MELCAVLCSVDFETCVCETLSTMIPQLAAPPTHAHLESDRSFIYLWLQEMETSVRDSTTPEQQAPCIACIYIPIPYADRTPL